MDQGALDLDTPVIEEYLPSFRMMDKQVTVGIILVTEKHCYVKTPTYLSLYIFFPSLFIVNRAEVSIFIILFFYMETIQLFVLHINQSLCIFLINREAFLLIHSFTAYHRKSY